MPPLPEQPGRTPVPSREARDAFVQWLPEIGYTKMAEMSVIELAEIAFNAGWSRRTGYVNHEQPSRIENSLFPQMELRDDV